LFLELQPLADAGAIIATYAQENGMDPSLLIGISVRRANVPSESNRFETVSLDASQKSPYFQALNAAGSSKIEETIRV